jgi:hypothetical protein
MRIVGSRSNSASMAGSAELFEKLDGMEIIELVSSRSDRRAAR